MKKIIAILLSLIMIFSFSISAFAANTTYENEDLYLNEESESVMLEGVNYTYHYYYLNGNRAINVVNNDTGHIDTIVYDNAASKIYLNNEPFPLVINAESAVCAPTYSSNWESLGTGSYRVSWALGTTVSVVAGAIATALGFLSSKGVIAAIGANALSTIASNSIGGTLTVETQWLHLPFTNPQYRYIWSFTASSGDKYGPYITHG